MPDPGSRARVPLPDRPGLRPLPYLEAVAAQSDDPDRRGSAAVGAGMLAAVVSTIIAVVVAGALAGLWLILTRLAA
jgi:hypothetical protein